MKLRYIKCLSLVIGLGLSVGISAGVLAAGNLTGYESPTDPDKLLKGRLVNTKGEKLSGVLIREKGAENYTVTDHKGEFSIYVSQHAVLEVGRADQHFEVQESDEDEIRLVLEEGELIHASWTQVEKRYFTGSAAVISGEELAQSPVTNLTNALAGRAAGLVTNQGDFLPGRDQSSLYLRGISTFGVTGSRVFVDGYERDFADFDPNEIESVTILKDAAANARFGIFGANRVIWVTTKRGSADKTRINVSSEWGAQVPYEYPNFLGSYDYARLFNEALANDGLPQRFNDNDLEAYRTGSDPWLYPDTDWHDELLRDRTAQRRHNFNISGGGKNSRYFVSIGAVNQQGLFKFGDHNEGYNTNSDYSRYNFRSNIDVDLDDKTSIRLDLAGRLENRSTPGVSPNDIFENISGYPRGLFPMLNEDGSIGGNAQYTRNPYGLITSTGYNDRRTNFFLGTVEANRNLSSITEGLTAKVGFSFDNFFDQNVRQSSNFQVRNLQPDGTYDSFGADQPLSGRAQDRFQNNRVALRGGLNYNRTFQEKHQVLADLVYYQSKLTINGQADPFATQLLSLNTTYINSGKYVGSLGLSYGGSENFAPGSRFGLFPTVSAAWIVSEEEFLKSNETIDFLKVRASFGILGNDNTGFGRFPYLNRFSGGGSGLMFGNQQQVETLREGNMANLAATWERGQQSNFGIDMAFFNNKLDVSLDAFYEKRTNILSPLNSVPDLIGALLPPSNVGIAENKGLEWDITYSNQVGGFSYYVRGLGSWIKNHMIYQDEPLRENPWEYRSGNPIGQPFALTAIGFFQNQEEIDNSPIQTYGIVKPGDLKFADLNGDGIIDFRDQSPIGKPSLPTFYYGAQFGFDFKGFDFSMLWQGVGERSVFILNRATKGFDGGGMPTDFVLNRWTPETAETADYPRLTSGNNLNNYQPSSFWQRDARYLRLRNVELGYTFPAKLSNKVGLDNARIYLSGFNLITISDMGFMDPEQPNAGIERFPVNRVFSAGIRVSL
ncbi:SusC/RagA family TonB-linked outer membrane protein [Belliella marina]|uniref:SusC/RagA family TonB-linked outer membrane protein n=1 Tax=Belliella marina TaxID=1644146 RepID=A0ABW4VUC3_9BACT